MKKHKLTKRIIVIGSGPSGLAAVSAILRIDKDAKIDVLSTRYSSEPEKRVGLKSFFGSLKMYDSEDIVHEHINSAVFPSAGIGGFSRVWGAVVDENSDSNFQNYIEFPVDQPSKFKTRSCEKILNFRTKRSGNWRLINHRVAVDPKKCIMCGNCLTGCPTNAIWFAGEYWSSLPNVNLFEDFRVQTIERFGDSFIIKSENQFLMADVVFIAAGPIGTSKILMKSKLIPNKVEFSDTQAIFFPALRFPIREQARSFGLSQISALRIYSDKESAYLQIYPDSRKIANSIISHKPIIGKLVSNFWKFFSMFIVTGILYRSVSNSPKLSMRIESDKFVLSEVKNGNTWRFENRKYRVSRSIFQDFGVLPMFKLGKIGVPGESYHFGFAREIIDFNQDSNNRFIKVVDASSIGEIHPGPITNRVMENAQKIVTQVIQELI